MSFKAILFMLGVTEQFRIDFLQVIVAIWFLSFGYLLYKRACYGLSQQPVKAEIETGHSELPCLTPEGY